MRRAHRARGASMELPPLCPHSPAAPAPNPQHIAHSWPDGPQNRAKGCAFSPHEFTSTVALEGPEPLHPRRPHRLVRTAIEPTGLQYTVTKVTTLHSRSSSNRGHPEVEVSPFWPTPGWFSGIDAAHPSRQLGHWRSQIHLSELATPNVSPGSGL